MGTFRALDVDGNHVYTLVGEHDMATVEAVDAAISPPEGEASRIIVDLSDTTYMDSTIIGMLVRKQRRYGARFRVVARAGTQPLRILGVTGLTKAFKVSESVDEAIAR